jgi:hypothetical protein
MSASGCRAKMNGPRSPNMESIDISSTRELGYQYSIVYLYMSYTEQPCRQIPSICHRNIQSCVSAAKHRPIGEVLGNLVDMSPMRRYPPRSRKPYFINLPTPNDDISMSPQTAIRYDAKFTFLCDRTWANPTDKQETSHGAAYLGAGSQ